MQGNGDLPAPSRVQARVKGSGFGMEPPAEARLVNAWFQWRPDRPPIPEVVLGNSGVAGEWRICGDGRCRTLSDIFGHSVGVGVVTMRACKPRWHRLAKMGSWQWEIESKTIAKNIEQIITYPHSDGKRFEKQQSPDAK